MATSRNTLESIRRVRVQYTSEGSEKAEADLRKVDAAQRNLAASSNVVSITTERTERRKLSAAAALDRYRAGLDASFRAQQQFERGQAIMDRALEQGVIDLQEHARLNALAAARLDETSNAQRRAAGSAELNTFQMANMSMQLNDMAVMLASGQNPFVMLMQQGMQMTQIFGPGVGVGAALKATGGALLSFLVNPLNLAVLGFASLAGGAAWAFSKLSGGSEDSAEDVERLHDELRALGLMTDRTSESAEELGDRLRNLAPDEVRRSLAEVRARLDDLLGMGSVWDRIGFTDDAAVKGLGAVETRLRALIAANSSFVVGADRNVQALAINLFNMVSAFGDGKASADQLAVTMADIGRMDITGALDGYMAAIRRLFPEVDALIQRQAQLQNGFATSPAANSRVAGAFDPIDRADAMERLRSAMTPKRTRDEPGFSDIEADAQARIAELEAEAHAFEMTRGAAEAYRFTQEMIAAARAQDIELTPGQIEQLNALGESFANAQMKLDGMRLTMENRGPFETLQTDLANLKELVDAGAISWETYADAQRRATAEAHATVAGYAKDVMGIMGQLFEDNKAVAIANAIVSTYEGVAKSLSKYPMPWAAVMAAAHLALGMKQVMAIKSTNKSSKSASSAGGGGGGSAAAGAGASGGAAPAGPAPASTIIQVTGTHIPVQSLEDIVNGINELSKDGGPRIVVQRVDEAA